MAVVPSASSSITVRLDVPTDALPASQLASAVETVGGMIAAYDLTAARGDQLQVDLTCPAPDADRAHDIATAPAAVEGAATPGAAIADAAIAAS